MTTEKKKLILKDLKLITRNNSAYKKAIKKAHAEIRAKHFPTGLRDVAKKHKTSHTNVWLIDQENKANEKK